jgi:hypothetical protein
VCPSESKTYGHHNLKLTSMKNPINKNQKERWRKGTAGACECYSKHTKCTQHFKPVAPEFSFKF